MEVDYLFQIGDNIVYPMQGAGIIISQSHRRKSQGKTTVLCYKNVG